MIVIVISKHCRNINPSWKSQNWSNTYLSEKNIFGVKSKCNIFTSSNIHEQNIRNRYRLLYNDNFYRILLPYLRPEDIYGYIYRVIQGYTFMENQMIMLKISLTNGPMIHEVFDWRWDFTWYELDRGVGNRLLAEPTWIHKVFRIWERYIRNVC